MMNYPRPGVGALRGSPALSPEMQRMRDWANSQRTATAANARNGDFILNPAGSGAAPAGVGIPTQMPTGDWRSAAPSKPSGWVSREDGPGIIRLDHALSGWVSREDGPGKPMPPVKPGMLPVKPDMPPPNKAGRLTGRRG